MSRTYTYPTIKTVGTRTRSPGSSDTANLQSMFPQTPGLADGDLPTSNASSYKKAALELLLDGEIVDNGQVGNYNRDFSGNGAPNYADVPTGGGGLPASAWVPNPVSPGEGSVNPADMAAAPAGYGTVPTNGSHSGASTTVIAPDRNPSTASANMSATVDIPDLGKSPATQNAS